MKYLLATIALLAISVSGYAASVSFTFDSGPLVSEFTGSLCQWTPGPVGWSGGGALQVTNHNGGWEGPGVAGQPVFAASGPDNGALNTLDNADPSGISNIVSFDILVDPTSFPSNDTANGFWQIIIAGNSGAGWHQTQVVTPPNWTPGETDLQVYPVTVNFATLGWTNTSGTYHQVFFGGNSDSTNPVNFYIDNFFAGAPGATPPPTNSIAKAVVGLHQGTFGGQYDRQILQTVASTYSWSENLAPPTTYSFTVSKMPGTNFPYNILMLFNPWSGTKPTDSDPDYNDPTCGFFEVNSFADGTGGAHFTYKVNAAAGDSSIAGTGQWQLYNTDSAHQSAVCTNTTPLGTWSLTFTSDDAYTITAPGGNTVSTNLNTGDGFLDFAGNMDVYIGTQAGSLANIGQEAVFSNFKIVQNGVTTLNDNFTTAAVDGTKWSNPASAAGTMQVPPGSLYTVSWGLPDLGFSQQYNNNLLNTGGWTAPGFTKNLYGGNAVTIVPTTWAATNKTAFFRLSE